TGDAGGTVPEVGAAGTTGLARVVLPPRLRSPTTVAVMLPPFLPVPAALLCVDPAPPLVRIASAVAEPGTFTCCTFGSSWQPANVTRPERERQDADESSTDSSQGLPS